ncbi:hypothetical protein MWH25_08325 [Natroniella acetigena]|uniref:hypothetical protein n=1 Tax=Natroniella acetigena TaxID=52004 RepID=UPI00200AD16C|nr:hypothetical protein [Natroniella acetigena]MCK8827744.1 hypothetical protein [Natroniella acetigena]
MSLNINRKILQVLNIFSFILVIFINALANILPLNDYTTGEVAELYPNLFTPAPITFSIWGLIYLLLAFFTLYQARGLLSIPDSQIEFLDRIDSLFFISSLANASWIFAWHYLKIGLSFLIMLVLLISLILIYNRLEIGLRRVSRAEKLFVHLPFSIYTGWITVATLANLTILLVDLNLYDTIIPATPWTIGMIAIAVIVGSYIYIKRRDFYYNLVIVWALLGIVVKRLFIAEELIISVALASIIGIIIITGILVRNFKFGFS